jgi:hypothetical protein
LALKCFMVFHMANCNWEAMVVNIEKLFCLLSLMGWLHNWMLCTIELSKPLSFILGKASGLRRADYLPWASWHTEHSGLGQDLSMALKSGLVDLTIWREDSGSTDIFWPSLTSLWSSPWTILYIVIKKMT